MRGVTYALGIGLGLLWIFALGLGIAGWLTWLDLCAAVLAIIAAVPARATKSLGVSDGAIGLGLLALWIIALAAGATSWLAWWTFAFGIAFLLASGSALAGGRRGISRVSHA